MAFLGLSPCGSREIPRGYVTARRLLRVSGVWGGGVGVGNETDNQTKGMRATMAKTQRQGQVKVMNRVARQVKGTAGRAVAKAKASQPVRKVQVTLGDLIAAAFDVAGEARAAARLVSSKSMAEATGRQIVVVTGC